MKEILTLLTGIILGIVGTWSTYKFNRRQEREKFQRDRTHETNLLLLNDLDHFFEESHFEYLYIPLKVSKEDRNKVNISFAEYKKQSSASLWSNFNEVTLYKQTFEVFGKSIVPNLRKIARESYPKLRNVAKKILLRYEAEIEGDQLMHENVYVNLCDPRTFEMGSKEKDYIKYIGEQRKEIFWIESTKFLYKLRHELERAVAQEF